MMKDDAIPHVFRYSGCRPHAEVHVCVAIQQSSMEQLSADGVPSAASISLGGPLSPNHFKVTNLHAICN